MEKVKSVVEEGKELMKPQGGRMLDANERAMAVQWIRAVDWVKRNEEILLDVMANINALPG